jgi:3-phenylpropionate/trans-cinnamate dioxygenase ferredoxin component
MIQTTISIADLTEGQAVGLKLDGVDVLLCQVEGQFYAVHAQCSHARQSLLSGRLRGCEIKCPLHGAKFDVRSGACLAAPAQQPIATFPVTIEAGKVCVDVHADVHGGARSATKPTIGPIY